MALFMSQGGPVLWWLAGLNILFWLIAIERGLYVLVSFPRRQKLWLETWSSRQDHQSWFAQKQRDSWLNQAHMELFQNINLLRLIISLFPMLGLLGTVTGMISVFDVLAEQGTSQPRLMAAGISMATLPTMAGMVAALAGMFFYSQLLSAIEKKEVHLEKLMRSRL
ncbi:MotA/TolQ/ExbB proton channel family protein [Vibrio sp. TH_r3]|uniref:MotA/TolQ/ExbB proton channel family protein n=1 Tax=Vibrio sp. TH_r3 TaxID=3082084 RepID=UPI0029535C13|nr:MotA/TolQ/ExbB proton channel family protein [Vibrio sp. TH_r3]MDV7103795.1 MotA/TolQ/ExbB proton channel family protein [Vibrio sp. TH_r3]